MSNLKFICKNWSKKKHFITVSARVEYSTKLVYTQIHYTALKTIERHCDQNKRHKIDQKGVRFTYII